MVTTPKTDRRRIGRLVYAVQDVSQRASLSTCTSREMAGVKQFLREAAHSLGLQRLQ
jgi:hypothetical protein